MLTDTQIIQREAGYEVMASHQVVIFTNGSTLDLHHVSFCGHPDRFLRAFEADPDHWVVVDMRSLTHRAFEGEMKSMPARDGDGLVLYTLRSSYSDAASLRDQALQKCRAAWFVPNRLVA